MGGEVLVLLVYCEWSFVANHSLITNYFPARLLRRYKRFLADILLPDGKIITVHCPNTGSMRNCIHVDGPCWYSTAKNPARKYPNTLEVVSTPDGHLAGINTVRANDLVESAISSGVIRELQGYTALRREVVYGCEKSRIDFLLENDGQKCYVEVKNVTLMEQQGQGLFPDSVSTRGTKHLRELMQMRTQGHRAVLLFCVQHSGIEWVEPAAAIDPEYAKTLRQAVAMGVEVLVYSADLNMNDGAIEINKMLPFKLSPFKLG